MVSATSVFYVASSMTGKRQIYPILKSMTWKRQIYPTLKARNANIRLRLEEQKSKFVPPFYQLAVCS